MEASHRADLKMVKTLIKYGADIHKIDQSNGFNVMLYACSAGHIPVGKELMEAGLDIRTVCSDNGNGMMYAAYNDEYGIMEFLHDSGIDINAPIQFHS